MNKTGGLRIAYRIHPLFTVVMLSSIATGLFVELITLFAIVIIHECGHIVAAKSFGWDIHEVKLLPFGGVVTADKRGGTPAFEEIIVALAGPFQNGLMIAFSFVMAHFGWWDHAWGKFFVQANVLIGLFNLLPLLPLDGGRILQSVFGLYLTYYKTLLSTIMVSLMLSGCIVMYSLTELTVSGIHLNLFVIGLFLFYSNWYAYRHFSFHYLRFLINRPSNAAQLIRQGTLARPIVVDRQRSIAHVMRLFMRDKYHLIYVLNEQGGIQGVLPEQRLITTYFTENKSGSAVSDLFV